MPNSSERTLATSVFPTPVGPTNSKLACGLCSSVNPARAVNTASTTCEMALSCPYMRFRKLLPKFLRGVVSFSSTILVVTLPNCATMESIKSLWITCFLYPLSGFSSRYAPASSMMSIALSGSALPERKRLLNFTARSVTPGAMRISWNFS